MKKIIITVVAILILIIILILIPRKNNKIKVSEVTHSPFYAPFYVALEQGYFKEEGLDIELLLTPGADKVSAAVLSGDVLIGLAGAESALYVYQNGSDDYLVPFSGLTKRDGQFIVGRDKDFKWQDLIGKEVLVGRKGGMPALNFLKALENQGIDKDKVNINYSIDYASLSGAFISGVGDFVNLFEPNATMIQEEGYGYVLDSIGTKSLEMPYTVFYTKKSTFLNSKQLIKKFCKAMQKGLDYVYEHSAEDIAMVILPQFKDTDINDLAIYIKNYKKADSWVRDTFISEDLLNNLEEFLIQNGLLDKKVAYEDIILNYE